MLDTLADWSIRRAGSRAHYVWRRRFANQSDLLVAVGTSTQDPSSTPDDTTTSGDDYEASITPGDDTTAISDDTTIIPDDDNTTISDDTTTAPEDTSLDADETTVADEVTTEDGEVHRPPPPPLHSPLQITLPTSHFLSSPTGEQTVRAEPVALISQNIIHNHVYTFCIFSIQYCFMSQCIVLHCIVLCRNVKHCISPYCVAL